uniref:Uncharacterized protein n=1 Tax=Aegilops tauschii subsp. strangulata TaxID=200361 RepID=A0A453AFM0_AEGTS
RARGRYTHPQQPAVDSSTQIGSRPVDFATQIGSRWNSIQCMTCRSTSCSEYHLTRAISTNVGKGFGSNGGQLVAPYCLSTHDETPDTTPPETESAAHTADGPESGWRRKRGPRKRRVPLCTDQSWHLGNHFGVRPVSILGWKFKLIILHM